MEIAENESNTLNPIGVTTKTQNPFIIRGFVLMVQHRYNKLSISPIYF
ncbi:MAG: hypothetical protein RL308_336, partial [Bacteroidota bacterium]